MDDAHKQLLTLVADYKTPPAAIELLKQNPPLIIAAASASGKNTVADYILARSEYQEVVTHTTRPPREGEVNGKHYWFVDEAEMLSLVESGAFIEVQIIHGDFVYGTSLAAYRHVLESNHQPLLVIEVQGVEELMRHVTGLKPFFILPPSYEEWMERLHTRGAISEAEKQKRLTSARKELEMALHESFTFVINRDVAEAAAEILSNSASVETQEHHRKIAQELLEEITNN